MLDGDGELRFWRAMMILKQGKQGMSRDPSHYGHAHGVAERGQTNISPLALKSVGWRALEPRVFERRHPACPCLSSVNFDYRLFAGTTVSRAKAATKAVESNFPDWLPAARSPISCGPCGR